MGGLLSSEPKASKWDGRRTTDNIGFDRDIEKWLREENRRSIPTHYYSYSTSRADRTSNFNSSCGNGSPVRTPVVSSLSCNNNLPVRDSSSKTIISSANFNRFQQKLYNIILNQCYFLKWSTIAITTEYQLIPLESWDPEYNHIYTKFMRGIAHDPNYTINVKKIERVQNIFLMGQYYLKKLEYKNKSLPVQERELFHGTKREHIDNICKNNLDWRLHGKSKGNIFGKGVSFTPKSPYANHYCDRNISSKVMIVAKVIISKVCPGNKFMEIPPFYDGNRLLRFDTSIKEPKKDVVVKYTDDEFYPAYLVHYSGKMFYHNKGFSR